VFYKENKIANVDTNTLC